MKSVRCVFISRAKNKVHYHLSEAKSKVHFRLSRAKSEVRFHQQSEESEVRLLQPLGIIRGVQQKRFPAPSASAPEAQYRA